MNEVEAADPKTKESYGIKELISKSQIMDSLIKLLQEHLDIVQNCFEANTNFELQRQKGFEEFVNFEIGKFTVAEILACYSDNILRKNGFKGNNEEYDKHLDQIVKLFSHLTDKDIFIMSFKNFLARRLLTEKSESINFERAIVTKLKVNCGR